VSRAEFVRAFEGRNVPAVIDGCTASWPAAREWTFHALRQRFPHTFFRVSDTHGAVLTLEEYWQYVSTTTDDCPFGLYDSQFGAADDDRQAMVREYAVPPCLNQVGRISA
jgi:hypothetical protein